MRTENIGALPKHGNFVDRTGDRIGMLTVMAYGGKRGRLHLWSCICDCGGPVTLPSSELRMRGKSRACGCMNGHHHASRNATHGQSQTRTYRIWKGMIKRCTNPSVRMWKHYGGRGIQVCDRWRVSFAAFLADMGECPAGLSIDRIENDDHYRPGNCQWATQQQQVRNRRPRLALPEPVRKATQDALL